MFEGVLNIGYSDLFDIDIEYGIDIDKYLKHETTQVLSIKSSKRIEPMPAQSRPQMPKGFALLCYNVRPTFVDDYCSVVFELYYGDTAKANRRITKDRAIALVESYDLKLVSCGRGGRVWE